MSASQKSGVEAFADLAIISPLASPDTGPCRMDSPLTRQGFMVANLFLLTCAFLSAQNQASAQAQNGFHLERGRELVYHGNFLEESNGSGVQFRRSYKM